MKDVQSDVSVSYVKFMHGYFHLHMINGLQAHYPMDFYSYMINTGKLCVSLGLTSTSYCRHLKWSSLIMIVNGFDIIYK